MASNKKKHKGKNVKNQQVKNRQNNSVVTNDVKEKAGPIIEEPKPEPVRRLTDARPRGEKRNFDISFEKKNIREEPVENVNNEVVNDNIDDVDDISENITNENEVVEENNGVDENDTIDSDIPKTVNEPDDEERVLVYDEDGNALYLTEKERHELTNSEMFDYFKSMLITAIITALVVLFIAQPARVNGLSMYPTFHDKQLTIIEKVTNKANYERGDIIVFHGNNELLIKRVVAKPGETIKIENNIVYINGKEYKEEAFSGIIEYYGRAADEITLGMDEYFVMGDNRNNSLDSRYVEVGNVNTDDIVGRVCFVFGKNASESSK